ncbi:MAG: hypothetical protein FVQ81_18240, partial [Candidatus Glassbacteria bacterium]|nr:hypothetical protein [Candidatus Glassbacteria bacterium]
MKKVYLPAVAGSLSMTDMNKKSTKSNTKQPGGRQLSLMICCALLLVALAASVGFADAVKDTPWLAGVTQTSVYACLEADTTADATVEFGLTTGYGSAAVTESIDDTTNGTYVHNVRLTGLQPNTVYNYQVTHGTSVSVNYTFTTAPAPGTPAHFGFAADCRSDINGHDLIAAQAALKNPNMMIYAGDLCNTSSYDSWANEWFVPNQATLNATVPFVNATGNHEGWNTNTRAFTESPSGTDGEGGNGYFSYDYGDVHILVLNNYVAINEGSAQWNFAAADLAASNAKFKIVTFHNPAISYGLHGSDGNMFNMTTQLFEPNGVNFVLSAHDHFYQNNIKEGIHHLVIGAFGLIPRDPGLPGEYHIYSEKTRCFAIFDTDGEDTLTLRTYRWIQGGSGEPGVTTLIETMMTDNTAPTPDPATFAINPAGVNGYTISMTATTGTDANGYIEYYFEETSGTPGGTDSGWQSSATYSDFPLTLSTSYSYRVQMRDIYGNTTGWSGVESASTTNEIDDQAPTPNPAQFDVAPYPTIAVSLTMTAVVGTDVNGPVEYYFTETSGAPGGSNSGWQSSPTYKDEGLSTSTQYTYTVMMQDGLGNVGTASAPVSGTTSSDIAVLFSVDHDNLPAVGNPVLTWDGFTKRGGAPTVVALGGEKWYSNKYATYDAMVSDLGEHAAGTSIPISGATIVTAVKPERYANGNWCLVVDIFYDQLCLGINNVSGQVTVKVSGASGANHTWTGGVIPEEPGVLSLTVASTANPAFEVFWRGENDPVAVSMGTGNGNTGGQPYTALYAQASNRGFAGYINLGRNNPDGWSTYNGLIGDTHVFEAQLSAATLLTVQDAVRAAMGIGGGVPDTDPPTPDPATFSSAPAAVSDTAISMTATTGTDASGPVQYYFDEVTGNPGGTDSGWQTSTSYTDTGLTASTQYT